MRTTKKLIALILSLSLCFCLSSCCTEKYSSTNEDDYEKYVSEVHDADQFMPDLKNLGEYESVFVGRKDVLTDVLTIFLFGITKSVSLIVNYDDEEYLDQKQKVLAKYEFWEEGPKDVPDVEARAKGFDFKVVDGEAFGYDDYSYGSHILFIVGFDEKDSKIAYLCFYDSERDRIKNLDRFIKKSFVLK